MLADIEVNPAIRLLILGKISNSLSRHGDSTFTEQYYRLDFAYLQYFLYVLPQVIYCCISTYPKPINKHSFTVSTAYLF